MFKNQIKVVFNGEEMTWEEAEKRGLIPKPTPSQELNLDGEEHDIEILLDEECKGFQLRVSEDVKDLPKDYLIDLLGVRNYRDLAQAVEDGIDYEERIEFAKKLNMI